MKKYVIPQMEILDMAMSRPLLEGSLTLDINCEYNGTDGVDAPELMEESL